jgi:hypothetical protein
MEQNNNKPSMKGRKILAEITQQHTSAASRLDRFVEEHPYMIAPNVIELIRHNLEDNLALLSKCKEAEGRD